MIFFFSCALFSASLASHIVGGDINISHIQGYRYRITLNLYFDEINGNQNAKDQNIEIQVYSRRTNTPVRRFFLPRIRESDVSFTQENCFGPQPNLSISLIKYSADAFLLPADFGEPEGYYVSWQRCCRNYSIVNITNKQSIGGATPTPTSDYAGQTFYLEFPAVVKDGKPFVNSTPKFPPALKDYACPGRPFYAILEATDSDGDELHYELVEPLNTLSGEALPEPSPGPYPPITWAQGYSLNHITLGNPDMSISSRGELTFTAPNTQGLYGFSVKVEERRNGIKIGESRREYQLFVAQICPTDYPPVIQGRQNASAAYTQNNLSVTLSNNATEEERTIHIRISDQDAGESTSNYRENITLRAQGVNIKDKEATSILPSTQSFELNQGNNAQELTIVLPQCPFLRDRAYEFEIIAQDDACPQPLLGKLKLTVNYSTYNTPPVFIAPTTAIVEEAIAEGGTKTWEFTVTDADGDNINTSVNGQDFVLEDAGFTTTIVENRPGFAKGTLTWQPHCNALDFSTRQYYQVNVSAKDILTCSYNEKTDVAYRLSLLPESDGALTIDSDLTDAPSESAVAITSPLFIPIRFRVTGAHQKNHLLQLTAGGNGFALSDYGMTFANAESVRQVSSDFIWTPDCALVDLEKKSEYSVSFYLKNLAACLSQAKTEILTVNITLTPGSLTPPTLSFNGLETTSQDSSGVYEFDVNTEIKFNVLGVDSDELQDDLLLSVINFQENDTKRASPFQPLSGKGSVSAPFTLPTDCSIFKSGVNRNNYIVKFELMKDRCGQKIAVQKTLNLSIFYELDEGEFMLPNVVTPNNDGCNDFFTIEDNLVETCGERPFKINAPKENCRRNFQQIVIVNRWGKEIFRSSDRKFKWYPETQSQGVYYYEISFTDQSYKGVIEVL